MSMNYYFLKIPKWVAPKLNSLQYLRINIVEVTEQTSTYLVNYAPRLSWTYGSKKIQKKDSFPVVEASIVYYIRCPYIVRGAG